MSNINSQLEPLVFTVPEIAQMLGIGLNAAYTLTRSRDFPSIKVGRKIIIPKQRFMEWLNGNSMDTTIDRQ
jgi:excisionase family DNA binding protein